MSEELTLDAAEDESGMEGRIDWLCVTIFNVLVQEGSFNRKIGQNEIIYRDWCGPDAGLRGSN